MYAFGGKADTAVCGSPLSRSLLGVKRTWAGALHMSAFEPKRTFGRTVRGRGERECGQVAARWRGRAHRSSLRSYLATIGADAVNARGRVRVRRPESSAARPIEHGCL